jgi:hypothetical protein
MLTDGVDAVDGGLGVWLSVSEIARQRGISKQAVATKVQRLALETRPGPQGAKLVSIAAYDKAAATHVDAVRAANGGASAPIALPAGADPILAKEQARRTAYQADIAKLDLDERLGKLIPADHVVAAIATVAEAIVRAVDQLPTRADEAAAAVGKEGAHGARAFLRGAATELRASIERALRGLQEQGLAAAAADPAAPDPG